MKADSDMVEVEQLIPFRRILVVDNEPSIAGAVATSLRCAGFEVEEAINGRMALAATQERPPDLIVLDVTLPDVDGV